MGRAFLSYARKTPRAGETLEAIKAALVANGWDEPFVDTWDIEAGHEWRRKLVVGLAETHAGVVLFSPEALDSMWVLQESSVMSFRCDLDPDYRFVPVVIDPITADVLAKHRFSDVALRHVQQVSGDPVTIAHRVAAALGRAADYGAQNTLLGRLATEIAGGLAMLSDAHLKVIGEHIMPGFVFVSGSDARNKVAAWIARSALELGGPGIYATIKAVAQRLGCGNTFRLLKLLAPLWIPIEQTATVEPGFARAAILAMNGRYLPTFTASAFLNRVRWPHLEQHTLITLAGGSDGRPESLVEDILEAVRSRLILNDREDARHEIQRPDSDLVVLLPEPLPDEQLCVHLRREFPTLRLIAGYVGERSPQVRPGVHVLPPIDLAEERDAYAKVQLAELHAKQFP
jgi:hypothetical protein